MLESSPNGQLDKVDRLILAALQDDGRVSNAELARRIGLSPPAVHARIRRLEEDGYVRRYAAILDPERLGYDITCFVHISLQIHSSEQSERVRATLLEMPEVLECYHLTGAFDYLLKVVAQDRRRLEHFLVERLTPIPGLARMQTSLVLNELKQTTLLSIPE